MTLDLIITPNNGVPAIIVPEQSFEAVLAAQAALSLENETGSWPVAATWTELPGNRYAAQCRPEKQPPAGCYALKAVADNQEDLNPRSVYVMDAFPDEYSILHITDVHTGTNRHPRPYNDILADLFAAANETQASFAVITGDLTENGEEEQFRAFIALLDACRMPTFVLPGNHDRKDSNYQRYFGPLTYGFTFGLDGYLAFDTKDFIVADEMSPQDGILHRRRRELRASRWSIGLTHRLDLTMGMRAQMILFIDDPLDCLIYGHYHREPGEGDGIPWGNTAVILTPAAIDGHFRLVDISARKILPQPTTVATTTGREAPPPGDTPPTGEAPPPTDTPQQDPAQ